MKLSLVLALGLLACLSQAYPQNEYANYLSIDEALSAMKNFFLSDEGIKELRVYARSFEPKHPVVLLIKNYILTVNDNDLRDLISELFKNIPSFYEKREYSEESDAVIRQVAAWFQTDEGLAAVRIYAHNLQTSHAVVLRLKAMLVSASDEDVKEVFREMFSNID